MAIEYHLTLAGGNSPDDIAARAVPDETQRPTPTPSGRLLSANLYERMGFWLDVLAGRHGCYEAQGDSGIWEWEPDQYVDVAFRMDKDPDRRNDGLRNMLEIVARLLASGPEDAALTLNGDVLLLARTNGVVCKHRRASWWDHYAYPNEIIVG